MRRFSRALAAPLALAASLAAVSARATTFHLPDFQDKGSWTLASLGGFPAGARPGGLLFSADGTALYVATLPDDQDKNALYKLTVTRNASQEVTALGPASKVFDGSTTVPGLDAGLEFGPMGTLFYSYFDSNLLVERLPAPGGFAASEMTFSMFATGVPKLSGLTFPPQPSDTCAAFACMHTSTGLTRDLFEVPLTPTAPGASFFMPGMVSSFLVRLPIAAAGFGVGGLHYIPTGTYAGDLLYAHTDAGELRILMIDPTNGLPFDMTAMAGTFGSTNPAQILLASGLESPVGVDDGGPLGLEFDSPRTSDLFVTTKDGTPANAILRIGGFEVTATTTTTTATSTTSTTSSTTTTSAPASTTTTSSTTTSTSSTTTTAAGTTSTSTTGTTPTTTTSSAPATTTTSSSAPSSTTTSSSSTTSTSSTTTTAAGTTSTSTTGTAPTTTSTTTSTSSSSSTTVSPTTSTSTTTASTTTTASLPSSTTSSSTPSTVPVTTTSTTLPAGCPVAADFASIGCRLAALGAAVDASVPPGRVYDKLVERVGRTRVRLALARERADAGRRAGARRGLGTAAKALAGFRSVLGSRPGRALPAAVREGLLEGAGSIGDDLRALRRAL